MSINKKNTKGINTNTLIYIDYSPQRYKERYLKTSEMNRFKQVRLDLCDAELDIIFTFIFSMQNKKRKTFPWMAFLA